jgi:translation initiation factor eIF-2B subunit gamma
MISPRREKPFQSATDSSKLIPRWVLDFNKKNERLESIGEDVIGWWAKAGWQSGLADKLQFGEVLRSGDDDDEENESVGGRSSPTESTPDNQDNSKEATSTNTTTDDKNASTATASASEPPSILAYIHSHKEGAAGSIVRRVDTAQLLLAISLQLAKLPSLEEADTETPS